MCLRGFINFYIVSKIFAKNIIKCQFLKINLVNLAQKLCAFVVKKIKLFILIFGSFFLFLNSVSLQTKIYLCLSH